MSVLKWGFGGNLQKVEQGAGSLPTLSAQSTKDNIRQTVHKLD